MTKYPSETIEAISRFIFIGKEKPYLKPSNLVLILGNDYIKGTIEVVSDFYKEGIITTDAKIILSGASGALDADKDLECNRLYECAVNEFQMDQHLFIKEPHATNAYLNFLYSKEIINSLGGFSSFKRILVIGKAFLARRAKMYASKLDYPTEIIQYYGTIDKTGRNIDPRGWWNTPESIQRVMAEMERIGKYSQSGDLSIF